MSRWDPRRLFDDESPSRAFVLVATLAFAAIALWLALHHEPWRDEADSWLQVRDADLRTIFRLTRYTGTPALWYLLLYPLPRLGLPYFSQELLHLLFATATVALLLAKLPLGRMTRLLAAFSYYFAYEYAVIARNYAVSILLIVIAAAMHRVRGERPLTYALVLALLCNVNAQGFFIAGALMVLFVVEMWPLRGRALAASAIVAAGAVLSVLQVRRPADPDLVWRLHPVNVGAFVSSVANAFLPNLFEPTARENTDFVFALMLIGATMLALRRSRASQVVFWLSFAALAVLHACIWFGGLRHAGFVLILLLVAIAIARPDRIDPRFAATAAVLLNLALAFSVANATRYALLDTSLAFSGAQEMGTFIRANGLERLPIAAHAASTCEAVLPYLGDHKQFWYAGIERDGSYMLWNGEYERGLTVPYPLAAARAQRHFAGRPWLLLVNVAIREPEAHGFRLLRTNREPIFGKPDERYWLYAAVR